MLTHYSVPHYLGETLQIAGPDAVAFAQSQFTSNVPALAIGHWHFSAWLDAQGRVRAFFHLARVADDTLLLLLRGGEAAPMTQALQRFVFRSKLTLTTHPARALGTGPAAALHTTQHDGDVVVLGCGDHSLHIGTTQSDDAWRTMQIRAGWAWLPASALDQYHAPTLSFERLQAVAFDKGCYPGQEIVARLHYRGGHKRHLHSVALSQHADAGSVLSHDGMDVHLLDAVTDGTHHEALAIISDDALSSLENSTFLHANENITLRVTHSWTA